MNGWLDDGQIVYLHCRAGWQRSAAVAAGVIALRDGIELDTALVQVQALKNTADPLPHQREDLQRWFERPRQPLPGRPLAAALAVGAHSPTASRPGAVGRLNLGNSALVIGGEPRRHGRTA